MTATPIINIPAYTGVDISPALVVRLALPETDSGWATTRFGAWWPRSRSLAGELPALIAELGQRGVRVSRVTYNPDPWDTTSRRLRTDGRVIRLGWYRTIDANLVSLTGGSPTERVNLLVIPPRMSTAVAEQVMARAVIGDRAGAAAALTNASAPPLLDSRTQAPKDDTRPAQPVGGHSEARWESDGGQLHR